MSIRLKTAVCIDASFRKPYVGCTVLPHPPYSTDFVPSEYLLFRHMKDRLGGNIFPGSDTVTAAVIKVVPLLVQIVISAAMQALVHHWQKCIASGGYCLEQ
jgi:hypothetical protein